MGSGYYNVMAAVLLVTNLERAGTVQDSCGNCPAGTFCGNHMCNPCPPNSFSSTGGKKACDICQQCVGVFRTKKPCSPTSNAECECIPGYHCLGTACNMCQQDCKQGQEFTKEGCKDCCFGTFNDQKHGSCRPWKNCSLDGKIILVNGTKEKDVVCGPSLADLSPDHHSPSITFFLAVTSAAILILVFFLILRFSVAKWSRKKLLYILKQPFAQPIRTAQEEDASSCRFPEEEEGNCEL